MIFQIFAEDLGIFIGLRHLICALLWYCMDPIHLIGSFLNIHDFFSNGLIFVLQLT